MEKCDFPCFTNTKCEGMFFNLPLGKWIELTKEYEASLRDLKEEVKYSVMKLKRTEDVGKKVEMMQQCGGK